MMGVQCPHCQCSSWTVLRRYYMGHQTVWWCEFCHEMIPTLRLVKA